MKRSKILILSAAVTVLIVIVGAVALLTIDKREEPKPIASTRTAPSIRVGELAVPEERTAPPDEWLVGLECPNIFADSDLVSVQTKTGSKVTIGDAPIPVSNLRHWHFVPPQGRAGSAIGPFDALEVRLVLSKEEMKDVSVRLVRADGRTSQGAGFIIYEAPKDSTN